MHGVLKGAITKQGQPEDRRLIGINMPRSPIVVSSRSLAAVDGLKRFSASRGNR